MYPKPDFSKMNGQQLLDTYNQYSVSQRRAKFRSTEEGIARCEAEWKAWAKLNPQSADDKAAEKAAKEAERAARKAQIEADRAASKAAKEAAKADKKAAPKKEKAPKTDKPVGSRRGDVDTIRILADTNPRRHGTDAHMHFEAMRKHPNIEKYLSSFEDRKKAGQWLWNTVRDGHVELYKA